MRVVSYGVIRSGVEGNTYTAEESEDDDDWWVEQHSDKSAGRESGDHLRKGHREDFGNQDHEEIVAGSGG